MKKRTKIIIIILVVVIVLLLFAFLFFRVNYISKGEVRNIVVENMKVRRSELHFESIDFELDKGVYEVGLYYQNKEYEFKIDAKDGQVIYTNYTPSASDSVKDPSLNQSTTTTSPQGDIGLEEAKRIALEQVNLEESQVRFLKTERDYDHGELCYEIEFVYQGMEYQYKISASTRNIVEFEQERIHD